MKRRQFIKTGSAALGTLAVFPGWLRPARMAGSLGNSPVLVAVFLRGGADGLNVVVPYGDRDYASLRPTLAIAPPGQQDGALDCDGFFGFHPRLTALKNIFDQGGLAAVHACGSHNGTRSHFDAMDYMESGSSEQKLNDGWLNRYLQVSAGGEGIFRSVALGPALPLSMAGAAQTMALSGLEALQVNESPQMDIYLDTLKDLNTGRTDTIGRVALDALDAIAAGKGKLDPESYQPANGADYGNGPFGLTMKAVAQTIKADVGLEVAAADLGGWDTHTNQGGGTSGELFNALGQLDDGLSAFVTDMGSAMDHTLVLVMTEFGRTARQNGSGGTDHGHGSVMFVLGGGVRGGKVYSQWPGLSETKLNEGRDLAVTTDFRRVFGETLQYHMGCQDIQSVFPGYDYMADPALHLFPG